MTISSTSSSNLSTLLGNNSSSSTSSSSNSPSSVAASNASLTQALSAANNAAGQQILTSLGAGSGVDVNSLAQNLVNAQEEPQQNIYNSEIATQNSKISGYSALTYALNEVSTAVQSLKDETSFNTLQASSSSSALTLTTTTGGQEGSHQVSVTQLAQSQQTVSDGFASASTSLNNGNPMMLSLTVGKTNPTTTTIALPAGRDTPQDIVNFINADSTNVTAQLVDTGSGSDPYEIVLDGPMGSEGAFTLNTSYSMASVASATSSLNSGKAMTLDLTVQGTTHSITVAAGQDTPQGIVTAIDNSGTGALASVDATSQGSADPYSLDITGPSGDSSDFSLSVDYGDGKGPVSVIQPGFTFTASNSANQTAQDAQMSVDGINYTRSSNTVTDVMPGVSMVLNSTTPTGSPATVQLTRDTSSVVSSINSLVQAYNDANNIFNAVQDPTSTAQGYGATLVGDSTALMLQEQLHSMFDGTSSTPGTNIQALWQIGISVDQTGVMSVDSSTLNTALTNNYSDVVMMMTGDQSGLTQYSPESGGIAGDAFKTLSNLTSSSGPLTSETNSADTEISQYQSDMTDLQTRMSDLLTRYQTEFASMNAMVGTINSEKASLSSSLAGLSG